MRSLAIVSLAAALVAAACSEDISPARPDGGVGPDGGGGHVTITDEGGGVYVAVVDATSQEAWIGLDLDARAEVGAEDAARDLAFRRSTIALGEAGVELVALAGVAFDDVTRAPASGWIADTAETPAFDAGDGWYSYDVATHILTPREVVYVIHTSSDAYVKLAILSYYDDAGTPAMLHVRFAAVEAPGSEALVVDASAAPVYVSVVAGIVQVADPSTSTAWDLRFDGDEVAVNDAPGVGGAREAPAGASYDDVSAATTLGYGPDVAWEVGQVYLVRTATGAYGKLVIDERAGGVSTVRVAPVARDAGTVHLDVVAADQEAWTYVSLRRGAIVTDGDWDVAFSRTWAATNSGTSGAGQGGAADPGAASIDDVLTAAGATFTVDEMVPIPGPPGSGEYSGNPVLGDWYDYDEETHVVSPKAKAFLVRTADGGFAKVQITSWADGTLGVDFAYAGAGRDDFQTDGSMP